MDTPASFNTLKKKKTGTFRQIFGGEFLISREMRPWYPYFAMIFVLSAFLVISEQRIIDKKRQIARLENVYKTEITRLRATNQFIQYEENQQLIQKMLSRGYILDEGDTYIINVRRAADKRTSRHSKKTHTP